MLDNTYSYIKQHALSTIFALQAYIKSSMITKVISIFDNTYSSILWLSVPGSDEGLSFSHGRLFGLRCKQSTKSHNWALIPTVTTQLSISVAVKVVTKNNVIYLEKNENHAK